MEQRVLKFQFHPCLMLTVTFCFSHWVKKGEGQNRAAVFQVSSQKLLFSVTNAEAEKATLLVP
jgi:hypothetical protein